ncbi:39S ribosomal protein L45, mitochondrial-like [Anneissia japonica]|uniref:39S ribosomal protein L45, mitochondrial-like n=1 Tax=Anneissia japonica TaxID=1529436 RepID=UPI0014257228|nr:39S ribosomal protein L45, mitochondrial-like [Anneissia japonica]
MALPMSNVVLFYQRLKICSLYPKVLLQEQSFPFIVVRHGSAKGRLLKKDKKRIEEREEHRKDPSKMVKSLLKKAGMKMGLPDNHRPITITCTGAIFEEYVPPEGDGKVSALSTEGAKQRLERVKNVGVSQVHIRKIRRHEPEFMPAEFAWTGQQIYTEANKALQEFDRAKLHRLVTEKCYPDMISGFRYKTIRWNLVESIEKPKVVHIRTTDMLSKGNLYGQVTVRMHTKQTLAIYDRFGRLMIGSETIPKDVLEYIVFEKRLVNVYGAWRVHGKIIPNWLAHSREPIVRTLIEEEEEEIREEVNSVQAT